MKAERWQKVKSLFDAAVKLAPVERKRFLDRSCGADSRLRRSVENLLDSFENAGSFLEQPAAAEVADVINESETKNFEAGKCFGHYEIFGQIGAGGMGEVYLAADKKLDRRVAIKILNERFSRDESNLNRFIREAKAASALNHPNILVIHEIGADGDTHYIVSEFIEGVTVRDGFKESPMKLSEVLDIAIQIAGALCAAHASGIVHRDIKPENIIVRPDGYVKILDFGLAKLVEHKVAGLEDETVKQNETARGVILGTVNYMSPEQAKGAPVDARTDIFSFGVLVYEMIAGRTPFAANTMSEAFANLINQEPPPLARFASNVPSELQRIVSKMLRKNMDERYQTARDLLIDLKSLQKRLEFEVELTRDSSPPDEQQKIKTQIFEIDKEKPARVSTPLTNSVAVLPFTNMSADADNEYFCDGLAEELLNALAKIDDLNVAARTSAFSFKGKNTNVGEIGNVLNVGTILEGSVRKSGNRLRITVQLVNAADGYHLWSERYDREMADIFDVQDEITLAVVEALKVKLFGAEKAAVLKRYTNNPEAYQLFLKGRYFWYKQTPENIRKSRDYFQQAIELDPAYAPGYAGLGEFYGISAATGMMPPDAGWQKAETLMAKARELDDTIPEVHNGLAAIRMMYYRDWNGAESELKLAVELNPNFAEAYNLHAVYCAAAGQFDDAVAEQRRALELDPLSFSYHRYLGNWLYFAKRFDEAIAEYRQAIELDANSPFVYEELGDAYERKGLNDEAIAAWQQAMTLVGDGELSAVLDEAYAENDFNGAVRAVARKRLERLSERKKSGEYVPAIDYARLYIRLGDEEQAFYWLGQAVEERNVFSLWMNSDPFYDRLRGDARFQNLLRRVGFAPATGKTPETR